MAAYSRSRSVDTLRVSREDGSCCLVHEVRTHPPTQRLREATFFKNAVSRHQAGRVRPALRHRVGPLLPPQSLTCRLRTELAAMNQPGERNLSGEHVSLLQQP